MFGLRFDGVTITFVVAFVAIAAGGAWLYDRHRWVPLAGIAAALVFFFVEALLRLGSSRPRVATGGALVATLPITLSMAGVLLARRRSVAVRVAAGLALAAIGSPIVMVALFFAFLAIRAAGANP